MGRLDLAENLVNRHEGLARDLVDKEKLRSDVQSFELTNENIEVHTGHQVKRQLSPSSTTRDCEVWKHTQRRII